MRKQVGVDPDAHWWKVMDIDTGEFIDKCFFADDETGEYGVYGTDAFGKLMLDGNHQVIHKFKKGRIKLIDCRA